MLRGCAPQLSHAPKPQRCHLVCVGARAAAAATDTRLFYLGRGAEVEEGVARGEAGEDAAEDLGLVGHGGEHEEVAEGHLEHVERQEPGLEGLRAAGQPLPAAAVHVAADLCREGEGGGAREGGGSLKGGCLW